MRLLIIISKFSKEKNISTLESKEKNVSTLENLSEGRSNDEDEQDDRSTVSAFISSISVSESSSE
jgi:hypothetical protein